MNIKRGDVVLTNLEPTKGSEQGKTRPCLVIQNNIGNSASPTTIVAAITSTIEKEYPFTVFVPHGEASLPKDSLILCNQIRTISKEHRILKKIGSLKPDTMKKVDGALKISLALE
ncbi:MAG: type II toxin-antitoxin system PemK/MazF family toxin [Candidatus Micrarchaeota archaeon]